MNIGIIYFWLLAITSVVAAVATVAAKNPIRGAMALLLMILCVAGLFLALHAEFLAIIQLIVYAGAIVVLFLFVIMLLGPSAMPARDQRGRISRTMAGVLFAACAGASIFLVTRGGHMIALRRPDPDFGGIDALGRALFSDGLVPFEVSSALLMVAVIGAVAVARGKQGEPGPTRAEVVEADADARAHAATSTGELVGGTK